MPTDWPRAAYSVVRRNLMRSIWDLASEEFGHPDHWPEWAEAMEEAMQPGELGEAMIGDTLVSSAEYVIYRHFADAVAGLPDSAWRVSFGDIVGSGEWRTIRRAAQELYEILTPGPRRRLKLAARSFAIDQVVAGVFLAYADARAFLLHELPADDPDQLMGYVLLIDEEVEGYRKFVHALRALPDGDGTMPFPEVVKLEGWPVVRQAAQQLYDCLSD
jgi:hypothetical protein